MAIIKKIKLPNEATARDIGALSSNVIYDGDAGSTATLNSKISSIIQMVGDINSFEWTVVQTLPTTGEDHVFYFVPKLSDPSVHEEYVYLNNAWELIGSTSVDLDSYVQFSDLADVATSGSYLDLDDTPVIPTVPTNVSYFTNDAGYITSSDVPSITVTQGLTTGVTVGTIAVDSATTTFYAPDTSNLATKDELNSGLATKAGLDVATTTTAGLMSAQDKEDLDRLKISGSTPITLSGDDEVEVSDAAAEAVQVFKITLDPNVTIVPGKNLANPATNIQGYYIGANGNITAQEGDWYTDLIPVSQGDHVYVSGYHNQSDNGNKRLHGYNASGTWVRQLNYAAVPAKSTLPAYYATDAVVPSGVAYVRFSYRMQDTNVMLQIGTQDPYEPYGEQYAFNTYTAPLTITKTGESTSTYNLQIPSMYGGDVDALSGVVDITWGHIDSYNGETLPGAWWSTYEKSDSASTPTTGSEVIYELANPQSSSITGVALTTDEGYNKFEINKGEISIFTYGAKGSIVSNLNITSGIVTLGSTSLSEQQLQQLLQLLS